MREHDPLMEFMNLQRRYQRAIALIGFLETRQPISMDHPQDPQVAAAADRLAAAERAALAAAIDAVDAALAAMSRVAPDAERDHVAALQAAWDLEGGVHRDRAANDAAR